MAARNTEKKPQDKENKLNNKSGVAGHLALASS